MANNFNSNWEQIQQGVSDVERLIRQKDYNGSMIKARQTLEFMTQVLCDRAGMDSGADLKTMIDQLYENRWISKSACEHYHKIRIIGNKAVHENDNNAYNANQAYHMLSQEVYTFATDNGFVKRGAKPISNTTASGAGRPSPNTAIRPNRQAGNRQSAQAPAQGTASGSGRQGRGTDPGRGATPSRSTGASRTSSANRSAGARRAAAVPSRRRTVQRRRGFTVYDLLKLLIPVLCIVLLFFIVKLLKPGSETADTPTEPTTPAIVTEAPVSEEPALPEETTAAVTYKTTDVLNVRSGPGTDFDRVGQLESGVTVDYVRAHDDTWAVILYNGQEAYVSSQYLTAQ